MIDIKSYWEAVLKQEPESIRTFFKPSAKINWHNTNEEFNVEEFIHANCSYPGSWGGTVERIEIVKDVIICVTHVYEIKEKISFHAISFIKTEENKIVTIDEYWGDDGSAPQWRLEKKIGKSIMM